MIKNILLIFFLASCKDMSQLKFVNKVDGVKFNTMQISLAVMNGKLEKIEKFFEEGLDINIVLIDGYTMLMLAVANGHRNIVEYLLQEGADINIKNSHEKTALDLAKKKNYPEITKILENKLLEDNYAGSEC